jgi:hypothetical protein
VKIAVKERYLILAIAAPIAALWAIVRKPWPQCEKYHDFADDRSLAYLLGIADGSLSVDIPNFLNVATNLPFLVVGLMGLFLWVRRPPTVAGLSWLAFFVGVTLVFFGSSFYHWNPGNETLVWDRLPMAMGFMALLVAVLAEHVKPAIQRYALLPAILAGVGSVFYWDKVDDLRPYFSVQAAALVGVLAVLIIYNARHSHRGLLWAALPAYGLAVASEHWDYQICPLTLNALSGHSLKHLLAGLALYFVYLWLRRREAVT